MTKELLTIPSPEEMETTKVFEVRVAYDNPSESHRFSERANVTSDGGSLLSK
jgi:hypothetical protein